MARPTFQFQRLKVYHKATDLSHCLYNISDALPPVWVDLRDLLRKHALDITLGIVRGAGRPPRREALRHFRVATRSTEFCESLLLGLQQSGTTSRAIEFALAEAAELKVTLGGIAERIQAGASAPDVFRDM